MTTCLYRNQNKRYGFAKYILLLLFCVFIGVVLLTLSYMIPVSLIRKNVEHGAEELKKVEDEPMWAPGLWYTATENYTDCVMLNIACYNNDNTAVEKALLNPWMVWNNGTSQAENLLNVTRGNISGEQLYYGKYWHGYLVFIKPLLVFFNYSSLKTINAYIIIVFTIYSCVVFYKKLPGCFVGFLSCLLVINPTTVSMCFAYSPCYIISMAFTIYLLTIRKEKFCNNDYLYCLFFFIGINLAFFDFLTYPIVTLAMPLLVILLRKKAEVGCEKKEQQVCKGKWNMVVFLIKLSCMWLIGYAGMWFGKNLVSTLLTNENMIVEFIDNIAIRTKGQVAGMEVISPALAIKRNVGMIANSPTIILLVVSLIFTLIYYYRKQKKAQRNEVDQHDQYNNNYLWGLSYIFLLPFLWYSFAANHSSIHCWFTYRALGIVVFCLNILICALSSAFFDRFAKKCINNKTS